MGGIELGLQIPSSSGDGKLIKDTFSTLKNPVTCTKFISR